MVKFFHLILVFFIHLGYFGPLLLGAFDSSFLILPFGNDLLVVSLIAQHHKGFPWYVLAASVGSTIGVLALSLVARKFGEEGIRKVAGQKKFDRLKHHLGERSGLAVVVACLAPPPFPFTLVIAVASALDYAMWKLLVINFFSRVGRFIILGLLAIKYGKQFLHIVHTDAFFWSMVGFIVLCLIATGYSVFHWIRSSRSGKKEKAAA
ncbi:MAG TPA: VTT domain-containing protein [Edaphobacter sp.]|uniref:YqaA family protein n=1 Tax=Edaphobacter sp. TaxID=1934404 RepID=UPI002B70FDB1|nr:VTT domain-containing protein [Edaphobacter sp.]HUZ96124.1 VTT domain-containing protein [Edaphobacter sp.]